MLQKLKYQVSSLPAEMPPPSSLVAVDMKDRPYPFFDHSSTVTRVTLLWKKRQII